MAAPMYAKVRSVVSHLPSKVLTNTELVERFPEWTEEKIKAKTGISTRYIAEENDYSSTLGTEAVLKLLQKIHEVPSTIDFLLAVTQTPDYLFPGISSFIHSAIGMRQDSGAMDVNLGCSGYVYALGVAKGLIESNQAKNVVLVTADTYSRLLNPQDKSVVSIFGDGATATWISGESEKESISRVFFGSDGSRASSLFVPGGGLRSRENLFPRSEPSSRGFEPTGYDLFMDGPEIFGFTIEIAEAAVERTIDLAGISRDEVDFYVFHQANAFMLRHLGEKLEIPEPKMAIEMESSGNTVSGTVPMAIESLEKSGILSTKSETICLVFGFGVGLSWSGSVLRLDKADFLPQS